MKDIEYILKYGRKPTSKELNFIKNEANITTPVWKLCIGLIAIIDLILILLIIINFSWTKLILFVIINVIGVIYTINKYNMTPKEKHLNSKYIHILDVNYYEKTIGLLGNSKVYSYKIRTEDNKFNKSINYIYGDTINYINEVYEVNSKFSKPNSKEKLNIRYIKYNGEEKNIEIANPKEYKHQSEGIDIIYFAVICKNKILYNAGINKKNIE